MSEQEKEIREICGILEEWAKSAVQIGNVLSGTSRYSSQEVNKLHGIAIGFDRASKLLFDYRDKFEPKQEGAAHE